MLPTLVLGGILPTSGLGGMLLTTKLGGILPTSGLGEMLSDIEVGRYLEDVRACGLCKPNQVDNVVLFLQMLSLQLHDAIPGSQVIWYDSVLMNGQLKWQNKLCSSNRQFFDACDGIFLNYNWSLNDLHHSLYMSGEERRYDVYVGVDVFGRGCFGGGGWNTYKALQVIREKNLSAAIFAPGWVLENCGEEKFTENNIRFWDLLQPYLYNNNIHSLPISTSFCRGYGDEVWMNGKSVHRGGWTNLSCQCLQPTFHSNFYQLGSKDALVIHKAGHTLKTSFNGGGCYEILGKVKPSIDESRAVFRLFQTDISLKENMIYSIEYTYKLSNSSLDVALLLLHENTPKYHVLTWAQANKPIEFKLKDIEKFNYTYSKPNSCETVDGWRTRKYLVNNTDKRTLQEIRFICIKKSVEEIADDKTMEDFQLHIGSLRIEEFYNETRKFPDLSNFRCRNFTQKFVDTRKLSSFILMWDVVGTSTVKCYDVIISLDHPFNDDGTDTILFTGRAYADAFHFTDLDITDRTCIFVKVICVSEHDVRQSIDNAVIVTINCN